MKRRVETNSPANASAARSRASAGPWDGLAPEHSAILAMQATAGNRAVTSLVTSLSKHRAGASVQRTPDEANELTSRGRAWNARVWMQKDYARARGELLVDMNSLLASWGASATAGHGPWGSNGHDPVVRTGRALSYSAMVGAARSQSDGGIQYAKDFQAWYSSDKQLTQLPLEMKALALITHWAEVGRGYSSSVAGPLYSWISEIASARTKKEASALWGAVGERFPPALTYKEDMAADFDPSKEKDGGTDIDEDKPARAIPAGEVADLLEDAKDFAPSKPRRR